MSAHPVVPIHLPPELVHKIFLHAAESSTSSCRTLCEVSTWTRCLALPHLYTTVSITSHTTASQLLSAVTTPPVLPPNPTFHPADAVQNIWITAVSGKFETLIQCCQNVSNLALDPQNFLWLLRAHTAEPFSRLTDANRRPNLDILMLHSHAQQDAMYRSECRNNPLIARITHLRLGDPVHFRTHLWLGKMRHLTHIAVPYGRVDKEDLASILPLIRNMSLKVFVLIVLSEHLTEDQCRDAEDWVCMIRAVEERVYVVRPLHEQLKEDWDAEVRNGTTIWERAFEYTRFLMSHV
ncbi:hypothetical protein BD779DRAFT_1671333 [Infundibulicybe gibba]|nr:hypothetical protein BD779DRAFT_1671333 [Infundibulicybe gibba]